MTAWLLKCPSYGQEAPHLVLVGGTATFAPRMPTPSALTQLPGLTLGLLPRLRWAPRPPILDLESGAVPAKKQTHGDSCGGPGMASIAGLVLSSHILAVVLGTDPSCSPSLVPNLPRNSVNWLTFSQ